MSIVKSRKELFALLEAICEDNRDYYLRFGKWKRPQIKVLWLEVNERFKQKTLALSGAQNIDKELYYVLYENEYYWIDTSSERIWQIFCVAKTKKAENMLKSLFLGRKGVDNLWALESFMLKAQNEFRYRNRGFGIKFKDIHADNESRSNFSAKLWIGRNPSENQQRLFEVAQETFSKSSIRFGKNHSNDNKNMSGELYELFYNGHMTVNTCDDFEKLIDLINYIKNTYQHELNIMENKRSSRPSFIETIFTENILKDEFNRVTFSGIGNLKLWLEPYEIHEDIIRYSGVDMHTGDFLTLDIGEKYSYISNQSNGCMNVAPRFGTISARHLSSDVKIFFDGVPLFV